MILYLDTSALLPLLIAELATPTCVELWNGADRVLGTRLAYVEAAAALAQAHRLARVSEQQFGLARTNLNHLWRGVDVIELDETLMTLAAELAKVHGLRGYDATHCAAAVTANDVDVVAASGDRELLAAWRAEGLAVCDVLAR